MPALIKGIYKVRYKDICKPSKPMNDKNWAMTRSIGWFLWLLSLAWTCNKSESLKHSNRWPFMTKIRSIRHHKDILMTNDITGELDSTNLESTTPYLDALSAAGSSHLNHRRFYFPSHAGGLYSPNTLKKLLSSGKNTSALSYDLPELDELDNLHGPEV